MACRHKRKAGLIKQSSLVLMSKKLTRPVLFAIFICLCIFFLLSNRCDLIKLWNRTSTGDHQKGFDWHTSTFHQSDQALSNEVNRWRITDGHSCRQHVDQTLIQLGLFAEKRPMHRLHKGKCSVYEDAAKRKHLTITNIFRTPEPVSRDSVTLVTHLTSTRFNRLVEITKTWTGPVSAAVLVNQEESLNKLADVLCSAYTLNQWKDVYLHIVRNEGELYPYNYMRNTAMNNTSTAYIFITDIDFIPMPNAYQVLYKYIRAGLPGKTEVLVIPAFRFKNEGESVTPSLPRNKDEVVAAWRNGIIEAFRSSSAHQPSNYSKWIQDSSPYYVQWQRYYEPYVVIRKESSPLFDERFVGRGYNKSSYIMQLYAMRFKFVVLPDVFIVHIPHSKEEKAWFSIEAIERCAKAAERAFIRKLKKQFKFHLE